MSTSGITEHQSSIPRVRAVARAAVAHDASTVVVVTNDQILGELIVHGLAADGRRCRHLTALAGGSDVSASVCVLDLDSLEDTLGTVRHLAGNGVGRVIALTTDDAERAQVAALKAGAIDVIVKPITLAVLMAKIERHLTHDGP